MRKTPAAILAACLLSAGLSACAPAGNDTGSAQTPSPGEPRGADTRVGAPDSRPTSNGPAAPGQPAPIGVQPVPDTPVANMPGDPDRPAEPAPQAPPPAAPQAHHVYVVSPSGNDTGEGNEAQPFKTIGKAISMAGPGDLIRVLAGTYAERIVLGTNAKAGTPDAKITLQGEGKPRIIPGPGGGGLVQVRQPNWIIDGFEVDGQNKAFFAVTFEGDVRGSVLANSELHHGASGAAVTTFANANGATIENNHIHDFVKNTGDLDSHGVSVQTTSKNITIRNNDIHDNSGDSVQCLGPEGFNNNAPADGLVVENNHFYANRENAVDIKTCFNVVIRNNKMHDFRPTSTAKGDALVVHYSAKNVLIEDNEVYNSGKGISVGGNHEGPVPSGIVLRRNRVHSITNANGGEGSGIRLENSHGTVVEDNIITGAATAALIIGHGTGGPTSNLTVQNNVIDSAIAVDAGGHRPGLKMGNNVFSASAQFKAGGSVVNLEAFKAAVGDSTSAAGDTNVAAASLTP